MQEAWVGKTPWRRAWQLIPVFLFGESPWTEEPGRLQSMGSQRVGYNWVTKYKYFVLHSVLNTSQMSVHLKYNTSALCFLHFPFLSLLSLSYNILCKPMNCSQESWSRLPCPPPGDLPDPGIEIVSLTSSALAAVFFTTSITWKAHLAFMIQFKCYLCFEVVHDTLSDKINCSTTKLSWACGAKLILCFDCLSTVAPPTLSPLLGSVLAVVCIERGFKAREERISQGSIWVGKLSTSITQKQEQGWLKESTITAF